MAAFVSGNGVGLFNSSLGVLGGQGALGNAGTGRAGEQAYVNVANGNLLLQRQDELLVGLGPDLGLVRTYNSQGKLNDDNGDNWRLGVHKRLASITGTLNASGSVVTRIDADGTELAYSYDAARGVYVNKDGAGSFDTLSYNSSTGKWTWTDGNSRVTETYDPVGSGGKLLAMADLDGNTLTYTYTGNLLTKVTDASGETTYFDYTGTNLTALRTVTAANTTVTRVRYGYDSNRLASVKVDLTPDDNSITDNRVYTTGYTYDGTSTRVATITQSDGTQLGFTYQTLADNSVRVTQISQTVGGATRLTTLAYDLATRKTTVTDPLGTKTVYTYDSQGRLTNLLGPAIAGASQSISYSYDGNGNVASQTDARGNVISYQYDGSGNLTVQRDAAGNTIGRTYGSKNQLLTETVYLSPDPDGAGDLQPAQPQTTRYVYDDKNHLRFTISADGRVSETRYDSVGRAIASLQYPTAPYDTAAFTPAPLWRQDFSVDASGLSTLPADYFALQNGALAVTTKDVAANSYPSVTGARNQPVGTIFRMEVSTGATSAGRYLVAGAANTGSTAANTYRRHAVLFGAAGVSASYYDNGFKLVDLGATKDSTTYVVEVVTAATGSTLYVYEKGKDRASGYSHWQDASDWGSAKTYLETFGGPGRAAATMTIDNISESKGVTVQDLAIWADGVKSRAVRVDTAYDFRGQVSSITRYAKVDSTGAGIADATQSVTQCIYDQAGQLLKTIAPKGAATPTVANDFVTAYSYDGLGRLLSTTDALNQVTFNLYDDAGNRTVTVLANGLASTSAYNQAGELISVIQADGTIALGETKYGYDAKGRLRMTQDPTGSKRYSLYDEGGRKVADIDGNGSLTEYRYNANNQLIRTIAYATALSAAKLATLVDGSGNPANVALASLVTTTPANDRSTWNLYDNAGRLVKSVDALGYVTETQYDGASRVTAVIRYANAVTAANITVATKPGDAAVTPAANSANDRRTRYFYNNDGQLVATLDAEGYLTENQYDAAGRLVHSIGWATRTASAQWASGTLVQLAPGSNAADIHHWTLYDGHGRNIASVDGEGYLTETTYDANGNPTQQVRYATKAKLAPTAITPNTVIDDLRPAGTAQDRATSWTYTDTNQVATRTDAEGTVTRYTYDSVGNVLKTDKAFGTTELRTLQVKYDKQGRVTAELTAEGSAALAALSGPTQAQIDAIWSQYGVAHSYDQAGRRSSTTDANGFKTLFYYDADGQLVYQVNALGEVTQNDYNALNQLSKTIRYGTRVASTTLGTLRGGLVDSAITGAVNGIANAALDSPTSYGYTLRGQLNTITDALGNVNTTTYSAFGELRTATSRIDAITSVTTEYYIDRLGQRTNTIDDNTGAKRTTKAVYDAFGRVTLAVDAFNRGTAQTYDRLGRMVQVIDTLLIGRSTTYDAFDRVLTQKDGNGNTTTTTYDKATRSMTVTTPEGVQLTTTRNRHGETVQVTDGNGNTTSYSYDKNGQFKSSTNVALGITESRTYDKAGRLFDSIDGNGVTTRYDYDAANRVLMRTVDPAGLNLTTRYGYDAKGRVITVTDANKIVTQTTYNLQGQAQTVAVDPTGLNLQTRYTYDGRGKVLTVTEGAGSANPRVTQYTYDKLGRRIAETVNPGGLNLTTRYDFDGNDNLVTKTDANNNVARYAYDAGNRLVYTVDAAGGVVRNDYDKNGNVIATTRYASAIDVATLAAAPTIAAIDALVKTAAADQVARTVYDKDSRAVFYIDAANQVAKSDYDGNGNVIQTTHYAAPIALPATITVATVRSALPAAPGDADRITRSVFDAANRLAYRIDALGYVTQNGYDKHGNLVKTIAYAKAMSVSGNPTLAAMQTTVTANADSAHDRVTRSVFDNANRAVYAIDPNGYVQQYGYDGLGHVTQTTRYADAVTVRDGATVADVAALLPATVPATALIEGRGYDHAGRLVDTTDGDKIVTRRLYDAAGRVTEIINALGTAAQSRTNRAYDAAGRLVAETRAYGTVDALTARYSYDGKGNLKTTVDARGVELAEQDSAWALATRKALGYLNADNSTKKVADLTAAEQNNLRALYTTTYVYDALGRKTRVIDALGGTTITQYDAFGNAVKVTDPRGNSGLFYFDKLNRVTLQVNPEGYVTQTGYTASGQPANVTQYANRAIGTWTTTQAPAVLSAAPSGSAPAAYLVADAARDQLTKLEYDKRDQLTKSTDGEGWAELYTYDGLGNRTSFTNKAKGVFTYSYDLRGKLIAETLPVTSADAGGKQVAVVNQYQYDARGNRIKTIEAVGLPEQRITSYEYDAADRQRKKSGEAVSIYQPGTGWVTTAPVEQQNYDVRGNLTERIDANGNRTVTYFDAANRRVAEVNAAGTLTTWTLDAAGNATAVRIYGDALTLPVDAAAVPTPVSDTNYRETRYAFDANNAQVESRIKEVTLGRYDNATAQYLIYSGDIVTSNVYDANGNLVKAVDGNGNATYAYYDRLGQKVLQIDAEGYAIAYRYDLNGSVATETKYANKLDATTFADLSTTSDAAALTAKLQENAGADDRITEYVYDRNNRLVQQRTLNVKYGSVDAGNGALTEATAAAISRFEYNGLGKITRRIDANGNQSDLGYDALGRQLQEQGAAFTDFEGATVRPTTTTVYDGIGNVKSSTRVAKAAADNQVTSYTYDKAGRMTSRQDPEKAVTNYGYDAAGNTTYTSLQRKDADGAVQAADVTIYRYDALNRQVSRQLPANAGTDTYSTKYSAYGDIVAKGVNGAWQEFADYNAQGKVWRTNSGQGIAKAYVYDANGNATLSVESAGADLKGLTLDQMLASSDVYQTYTLFDKRNAVIDTIQPRIDYSHDNAEVQQVITQVAQGDFTGGLVTVGPVQQSVTATADAAFAGQVRVTAGNIVVNRPYGPGYLKSYLGMTCTLPDLTAWGDGNIRVEYGGGTTQTFSSGTTAFDVIPHDWMAIYKETPYGDIQLYSNPVPDGFSSRTVAIPKLVHIKDQSPSADRLVLFFKSNNGTMYTQTVVPKYLAAGWFAFDWSGWGSSSYDIMYMALDPNGNILNCGTGQMVLGGTPSASYAPRAVAAAGFGFFEAGSRTPVGSAFSGAFEYGRPTLHLVGQGASAQSITISYRKAGSSDAWTSETLSSSAIGGKATPGWFSWKYAGPLGDCEFRFEAKDGAGRMVNKVVGTFSVTGASSSGYSAKVLGYTRYDDLPTVVRITGQPTDASSLKLQYRPVGSSGDYATVWMSKYAAGAFDWDAAALVGDSNTSYDYEFIYESYDASASVINKAHGSLRLGAGRKTLLHVNDAKPPLNVTALQWVMTGITNGSATIHRKQEINAFGDVSVEIDGLQHRTDFTYNTLGRLTRKLDPETDVTLENGFTKRARPETLYYYDLLGQVVGTRDANRNLQTQRWTNSVAGGWLAQEYHADGGKRRYQYDMLGNQRVTIDENEAVTRQAFDKNNRLVRIDRPVRSDSTAPYDIYEYDSAGNRIAHTNALKFRERFYYDGQNRVVQASSFAGRTTRYSYSYDVNISGLPGSVAGGWVKSTTDANELTQTDKTDTFGRQLWHKDLGDHTFSYAYDAAGRLRGQTGSSGQQLAYTYYANGYVESITDKANGTFTKYEYDDNGNRTFEHYSTVQDAQGHREFYENSEVTYDELNRIKRVHDPKYDIQYEYDAVGNRRRVRSDYHDGVGGNRRVQDYWYKYDGMNRFTVTMGSLSGARATSETDTSVTVVRGSTGAALVYDRAGQRKQAVDANGAKDYSYTADGYLEDVKIDGKLRARRVNDAAGRVGTYYEYDTAGATVASRTTSFDADNRVLKDHDNLSGKGTEYKLLNDGTLSCAWSYGDATEVKTYYKYQWWDSAKELSVTSQPYNNDAPDWKPGDSFFFYDANGNVKEVQDGNESVPRTLRYVTNGEGLILRRDEIGTTAHTVNKTHNYYYASGHRIGDVGDDGESKEDYAQALARDKNVDRKDAYKRFKPVAVADFDQNYLPINSSYPGMAGTSYVVQGGDTLQGIALRTWGDASMWYLIGDANGLTGQEALTEGMRLTIPNKVTNIHNNSTTFQVYNPGEAIGDTSPMLPDAPPPPGSGDGCGGFAKILIVIVAIVATVFTAGAAAYMMTGAMTGGGLFATGMAALGGGLSSMAGLAAAAIGGAVGSIASQGVAMALGMQDSFSWSGVAMGAMGAAVGAGMGSLISGSTLAPTIGRAVAGNVITQGMAVATGLQKKFDWRGVAASAVGSAAGYGMGEALRTQGLDPFLRGSAIGLANGGAYALASGQKPNWGAITAQSFGSTLGNHLAESAANGGFGNALGDSIVGQIGQGSQQTGVLNVAQADAGTGSYWDTHPMMYASNDVADPWSPNVTSDAAAGSYAEPVDFLRSEKASYQPGDFNRLDITKSGDTLADLFRANYGYAPSHAELVQYGNYNDLTSAHDLSLNREIISPSLEALQNTAFTPEQLQSFSGRDAEYAEQRRLAALPPAVGIGPTIANARAMGIYSGDVNPVMPRPEPYSLVAGSGTPMFVENRHPFYDSFEGRVAQGVVDGLPMMTPLPIGGVLSKVGGFTRGLLGETAVLNAELAATMRAGLAADLPVGASLGVEVRGLQSTTEGAYVWHATANPRAAQGVLNGIDPKFLNPDSRFGAAFYVAEQPGTTLAELAHHGVEASHGIRFSLNRDAMNVLDLTKSEVATSWGYQGGPISSTTQAIGTQARDQGYNVIRFYSERANGGINHAVLDNFNDILKPVFLTPVKP